MAVIIYIIVFGLLLSGIKKTKNNSWNYENMSYDQTKSFLGFCSVIIVFHHIAQDTCGPWLGPLYLRHGLELFLSAGYPAVSVFFFCSGFGLYKSAKNKPDFFKHFLLVRLIPIIFPALLATIVFVFFRMIQKPPFIINNPFSINSHETLNPYIWYIPCIILLYILFYIGFGRIKNDLIGIIVVAIGTLGYVIFCYSLGYGTFWFNSIHMFLVGIIVSKYEKAIFESCINHYLIKLLCSLLLCVVLWFVVEEIGAEERLLKSIFQILFTFGFVSFYYLASMKLRVGNMVLSFLGRMTLELYLVHGIFVKLFGYYMAVGSQSPVLYIDNILLYSLVVFALSIPVSYCISILDKRISICLRKLAI